MSNIGYVKFFFPLYTKEPNWLPTDYVLNNLIYYLKRYVKSIKFKAAMKRSN